MAIIIKVWICVFLDLSDVNDAFTIEIVILLIWTLKHGSELKQRAFFSMFESTNILPFLYEKIDR